MSKVYSIDCVPATAGDFVQIITGRTDKKLAFANVDVVYQFSLYSSPAFEVGTELTIGVETTAVTTLVVPVTYDAASYPDKEVTRVLLRASLENSLGTKTSVKFQKTTVVSEVKVESQAIR